MGYSKGLVNALYKLDDNCGLYGCTAEEALDLAINTVEEYFSDHPIMEFTSVKENGLPKQNGEYIVMIEDHLEGLKRFVFCWFNTEYNEFGAYKTDCDSDVFWQPLNSFVQKDITYYTKLFPFALVNINDTDIWVRDDAFYLENTERGIYDIKAQ